MKTRILIIALAMVFVSALAMAGPGKGNNIWGEVPAPYEVSANLCNGWYTVEWKTDCDYPGTKFSVVFFADVTFALTEECGGFPFTDVIGIEVDFGTSDEMDGLEYAEPVCVCGEEPYNCTYMLDVDEEVVDAAVVAAIEEALGDCLLVLDGDYDIGPISVKVKGLNPGKGKGRQNNMFSEAAAVVECGDGGNLE
jgi:hypothetical protein